MALLEISELNEATTIDDTAWLHGKIGAADFKLRPQVLFDLYNTRTGSASNLTLDKASVGLGNVTNVAQLAVSLNLSDLPDPTTARGSLNVDSSVEVNNKVAAHANANANPHGTSKAHIGLGSVPNYTATSTITDTSTTKFATINAVSQVNAKVDALALSFVPGTGIIMWPSTAAIPAGWRIMDGTNGTIDMRGQFVRGGDALAGPTQVGTTGGQDSYAHTHNATAAGTAITVEQMPSHRHSLGHKTTYSHLYGGSGGSGTGPADLTDPTFKNQSSYEGGGQTHTHTITVDNNPAAAQSNLPPYYTLIFIQKI